MRLFRDRQDSDHAVSRTGARRPCMPGSSRSDHTAMRPYAAAPKPVSVQALARACRPYCHTSIRGCSERSGTPLRSLQPLPAWHYTHTRLLRTQRDAAPLSPAAPSPALHPYAAAPNAAGRPASGRFAVHGTDAAVCGSGDLYRRMPAADALCPDGNQVVGGLRIRHPAPKRAHSYTKPKTAHMTQFFDSVAWRCGCIWGRVRALIIRPHTGAILFTRHYAQMVFHSAGRHVFYTKT